MNACQRDEKTEVFGKDLGLMHEVIITGRKVGVPREFYSLLAENPFVFKHLVEMTRRNEFPLQLDPDRSFEEALRLSNNTVHPGFVKAFQKLWIPITGSVRRAVKLVGVSKKPKSIEDLLADISQHGTPSTFFELLHFAEQYPMAQDQYFRHGICAFGDTELVARGEYSSILHAYGNQRHAWIDLISEQFLVNCTQSTFLVTVSR